MSTTIFDLARHRLGANESDTLTLEDFERAQLPMMGGCYVCGATVAAYNSCPTSAGYIACANGCTGDLGYETPEAANAAIFDGALAA